MSTTAPLWPQPIPIIGGTGEKWAGKTKFGLNICPGNETTLVYDFEQSSASFEGEYRRIGVPFVRIDVQEEMHKTHPGGYKPIDLFSWWLKHVRAIPANKYRVIQVDPVTDIERGLTDWVGANPKFFGHTEGQYASMSGIMWGDVKDFQKMILADICAKCETFYFTAHIGAEFQGKQATGKKKVKGKETLYELASLFLWFDRSPDAKGVRPNEPSAAVMKARLEVAKLVDGEVQSVSVLPPRLPVATPKAIRSYFAKPAGGTVLSDGEKVKDDVMSADERLRLETAKAEAERDTAVARAAQAQAAQPTVVITHAPEEENRNSPESWEFNFSAAIDLAENLDQLADLPNQIGAAQQSGFIGAAHVERLKAKFKERKAALAV